MKLGRREFLEVSVVAAGGTFVFGCDDAPGPDAGRLDAGVVDAGTADAGVADTGAPDAGEVCADPFDGGDNLGASAFVGEDRPQDVLLGSGLSGRLYTDLTGVDENVGIVANDLFFIRTFHPPTIDRSAPWEISIDGLVAAPITVTMADVEAHVVPQGRVLLECSGNPRAAGNGLLGAAEWSGAPLMSILEMADVDASATRVLISGHDYDDPDGNNQPGASWIFTFDDLRDAGAFLATEMNGVPLPDDHGFPVRLCVPGWYGCTNIKWVNEIRLVDDDEPSTAQMREFAFRTHQNGVPPLARDFIPAIIDQAAMPIRIEKWRVDGQLRYRVVGVLWGGSVPTQALSVRFGAEPWTPVDVCPAVETNQTWSFWSHEWRPASAGNYEIRCRIDDPSIRTRRLDVDRYIREVEIDEV